MLYNDDFLDKKKKETAGLLHFLQECKYAGSMDTRLDLNIVIKALATYATITEEMRKEIKKLQETVKTVDSKTITTIKLEDIKI